MKVSNPLFDHKTLATSVAGSMPPSFGKPSPLSLAFGYFASFMGIEISYNEIRDLKNEEEGG